MGDLDTRMWRRLRYSMTTLPQSSLAGVPVTFTELQKMKSGTGGMKNLPLKERKSGLRPSKQPKGAQDHETW